MGPSLLSKSLQGVAVTGLTSIGAFLVWTKHCSWSSASDFNPATQPLFQSRWFKTYNPIPNPTMHDECVRRIPLHKLKTDLVEDSQRGGPKLIEAFSQGIWGGPGYTIQRLYLQNKYRNAATEHQLWTSQSLLSSEYETGTVVTDHFLVLDKSPASILFRCGDAPRVNPDGPRENDGLFELNATTNFDKGYAEFKLRSIFFAGEPEAVDKTKSPLPAPLVWLHQRYTDLLMESAMSHIKR